MKKIDTLASIEGRTILQEIFYELRYERQNGSISSLLTCWKICVYERELNKYIKRDISLIHALGIFKGSGLWMEEIVNRFYFSTINSFVYFGASILLVLIGLRRFSDALTDNMVIGGVIFEAAMLLFMFVIMLFTPNDEAKPQNNNHENNESDILINEVGEIGRDFAAAAVQMEQMTDKLSELIDFQRQLLSRLDDIAKNYADAAMPNPKMIDAMMETNTELQKLKNTVSELNESLHVLRKEEIEAAVKREIEKLIVNRIS
jgi:hypothetical protein